MSLIRWWFVACSLYWFTATLLVTANAASPLPAANKADALRQIVSAMKDDPRGPFFRLRWFCNDGAILPPKPFACVKRGGGHQHGQWSKATLSLHQAGFSVANVLAELGPEDFGDNELQQRHFRQLLLERFLIAYDDGWIFRKARFYRGARQAEDEEAAAHLILQGLLQQPQWLEKRFALLFEAARLLPHASNDPSVTMIRGEASVLAQQDPDFAPLRAKIHGSPDRADAQRVRDYALRSKRVDLQQQYAALAQGLDAMFESSDLTAKLEGLASSVVNRSLSNILHNSVIEFRKAKNAADRLAVYSHLLPVIRSRLAVFGSPALRLQALDLSVALQQQAFIDAMDLSQHWQDLNRQELLRWMQRLAGVLVGTGLLTPFERDQLDQAFKSLENKDLTLHTYREKLHYLARVPDWVQRRLKFYFARVVSDMSRIEPLAANYLPDRLRSSPLLAYSALLDVLSRDAARLTGYNSELFGKPVALGLHSLSPGLARGTLRTLEDLSQGDIEGDTILIVPETLDDLPPVAGILTAHEGNALSHVQILARNLGIPNVVVSKPLLPMVHEHRGELVELAASPGGIVRLTLDSHPTMNSVPVSTPGDTAPVVIYVNVDKLNLERTQPIPVSQLRGGDSGVMVGPKAAQVGELSHHFPQQVSAGLVIPFGVFQQMLQQPAQPGDGSMLQKLQKRYAQIAAITDTGLRTVAVRVILENLRSWIMTTPFPAGFEESLRHSMQQSFGEDGSYGVFVRSDTNVEDLPGFTGAGLNLTVPNVVGFNSILQAIRKVWASPFSERAYAWRQALMDKPEHLYAAVLLHKSVANDISGVMVTADVDSGSRDYMTLVVNEGVAGGVDGQGAETLRVRLSDAHIQLLNSASAPQQRILLPEGGSQLTPASGAARLLSDDSIRQLIAFTRELSNWFSDQQPAAARDNVIADVEFGFTGGQLMLFQIRPFVQDELTASNLLLRGMDEPLAGLDKITVDLHSAPKVGGP